MSRAGFDYRLVWSPDLTTATPIVHRADKMRTREVVTAQGLRVVRYMTDCGHLLLAKERFGERGRLDRYVDRGVRLYAGHATAMGARFCRRCWPGGES